MVAFNGREVVMLKQRAESRGVAFSSEFVFNELMSRHANNFSGDGFGGWGGLFGEREAALGRGGGSGCRDIDTACDYPSVYEFWHYRRMYERQDIARRVVDIWPDECWAVDPEVYETDRSASTPFEKRLIAVAEKSLLWHYLHRLDKLSGIGQFGIMLLGLNDGQPLNEPVAGVDPDTGLPLPGKRPQLDVIYLRTFDQGLVQIQRSEGDTRSPRYGQPTAYNIQLSIPVEGGLTGTIPMTGPAATYGGSVPVWKPVHWTRVIHAADNRECSEVYGSPRLRVVADRLHDVKKVCGGSAEMFWRGGFPGYAFTTSPTLIGPDVDAIVNKESIEEDMEKYAAGLRRYLVAVGGEWKSLAPQVANPGPHMREYLNLICAAIGVPLPIFLGYQQGQLAGNQDASQWKDRLSGRQNKYINSWLVRPTVDRLINVGVTPPPADRYMINWRDLRSLSDKDLADVALKRVQALMQYVGGKVFTLVPPRQMFTKILGFSDAEADAVIKELGGDDKVMAMLKEASAPPAAAVPQGGGRKGKMAVADVGRPANGPPEGASRVIPAALRKGVSNEVGT